MMRLFMNLLLNPDIAYLVLVLAFVLTFVAILSPGTGLIEAAALLSLIAAGYSIYYLPLNYLSLVVLLVGAVPFLLAVRKSGKLVYLVVSIATLVIGSSFLFRSESWLPAVNPLLALVVSTLASVFIWIIARKSIEASLKPPMYEIGALIGRNGLAATKIHQEGSVQIESERWSARSNEPVAAGTEVRIISREGLTLVVEKA
jgi:membrane-bound serine protease (ClpP class)